MDIIIKGINGNDFVIKEQDKTGLKFAMLFEAHCTIGPAKAIKKYGYTLQWYYKLLKRFKKEGSAGLIGKKKGPLRQHVRTQEVTNQIIRLRFLDPDSGSDVIAQKMKQNGYKVSVRSVERTITEYGLQKKRIT